MFRVIGGWLHRYFSDEEAIVLLLLLAAALVIILVFGTMLAPVFAGLVLAFVLQGSVAWLERMKCPHMVAVTLTFVFFIAVLLAVILLMMPLIWEQGSTLLNELPRMVQQWQQMLLHLPEAYPGFCVRRTGACLE